MHLSSLTQVSYMARSGSDMSVEASNLGTESHRLRTPRKVLSTARLRQVSREGGAEGGKDVTSP
jgi:hypothetical protein